MRILVVEDEEKLARYIKRGLERSGYAVDYLTDGEAAQHRIEMSRNEYDLVLLDLMLPKKDGVEVCKEIRAQNIKIPILVLTARDTVGDKTRVLDVGADDYLVKPFSFEELKARIKALLRRPEQSLLLELKAKDLVMNTATRRVTRNGKEIPLTLKEFSLLEYLMRHPNEVLNREKLWDHIWDFAAASFSNTLDVHIKNLRKKIDHGDHKNILETIRGVGYRLKA